MSISLSSSLASMASLAGISGLKDAKLDYTSHVTGLNTDTKNVKLSINGNLLSYSIGLDISGTISNKANISEITSSNSVDVFALSQEDFKSTYTDVIKSAADKLPSKLSDFGITVTKEDILKLLPAEEPSTQSTTLEAPTDTTPVVVDQPAA